ncbi:DUF445 family protein [Ruminococcus sp. HUN007]|uniref:DUF445 domain-containing protein n=1 Tax=Ruminococcus sp. HUN007 TaxID=1514668 RepID=UPI0005D1B976|nr:DUF445 family protein [Ruminococcus sp. HUN007]
MNYELITAPIIGAAIGTVTNGIAIRMLFRPWKPVFIGKFQLPFTPGLIPKEKPRIAKSIADVIGNNLLDDATIRKSLLSDDIKTKITTALNQKIESLSESTETLSGLLDSKGIMTVVDDKEKSLKDTAGSGIARKMIDMNVASSLLDFAEEELANNSNPLISGFAPKAISSARDSLVKKINDLITEKAPTLISGLIDKEYEKLKDKPVGETIIYLKEKFPDYEEKLWALYSGFIEKYLTNLLKGFNISGIVEQKINEFELPELEKLIMDIARKELNALVALGGLLGFLMGFLNVLLG